MPPSINVSSARRIAFEVLRRVEQEDAYAADLLYARLGEERAGATAARGTRDRDAALATELTLGTLRWQRLLDFLLDKHSKKPVRDMDVEVRLALRLGMYQLRFLTRVPARAAVDESVELVKKYGKRSAAGLVNAVLRRAASDEARRKSCPEAPLLPADVPTAEGWGMEWSHPTWMVERWLEQFGEARSRALLKANNQAPQVCLRMNEGADVEEIAAELRKGGMKVEAGRWLRAALTVRGGNPAETEAYRRGEISIQDEASQMVGWLLGARKGERVLDLCAAPGGKTTTLARQVGATGRVVAADRHRQRLSVMREHLHRVGAERVELVALDGTEPLPFRRAFDRVLVDAPCSGTGTLARNPEIRWRLKSEDLRDFHDRQVKLLWNALEQLKPGGRVVYSTCSLEAEENEHVLEEVLKRRPEARCVSGAAELSPHLRAAGAEEQLFDRNGYFRTFPLEHGTDGFFAAVLERD